MIAALKNRMSVWVLRLSVGLALLFYSELLWWGNDPGHYTPLEWAALVVIYTALGALLLDLAVRYWVADVFGLALLGGIYAVLNGLLITHAAFEHVPLDLIYRLMGQQALAGGSALLLLVWVFDRRVRMWRFAVFGAVGVVAGIWIRWFPLAHGGAPSAAPMETVMALLGSGLVALGLVFGFMRHSGISVKIVDEEDVRLRPVEWLPVLAVIGAVLGWALVSGAAPLWPAIIVLGIGGLLLGVLYLHQHEHDWSILDALVPLRPVELSVLAMIGGVIVLGVLVGYGLPGIGGAEDNPLQIQVLAYAFLGLGFLWVPVVSVWVGARAYIRDARRRQAEREQKREDDNE